MTRPPNLPSLPDLPIPFGLLAHDLSGWTADAVRAYAIAYARAAVEADRKGIVVTDEDVEAALTVIPPSEIWPSDIPIVLESYAKRLRGET